MDNWIFLDLVKGYGPLATNLWSEHFTFFELTQIMRQKDDIHFAQLLNRLREGLHTESDIDTLKTRLATQSDPNFPFKATHLMTTNRSVDLHNSQVFSSATTEKVIVTAADSVSGRFYC